MLMSGILSHQKGKRKKKKTLRPDVSQILIVRKSVKILPSKGLEIWLRVYEATEVILH